MTTGEAADHLNISRRRLQELVASGALPAERQDTPRGPIYWLRRADLERFREQRAQESAERRGRRGRPLKVPPREPEEG